jgi:hypothetical protein
LFFLKKGLRVHPSSCVKVFRLSRSTKVRKVGDFLDLSAEEEVAELGEGEEDDEEHDTEACDVLGAAGEGRGQLGHGLVEGDVFEQLDPGAEYVDGHETVALQRAMSR